MRRCPDCASTGQVGVHDDDLGVVLWVDEPSCHGRRDGTTSTRELLHWLPVMEPSSKQGSLRPVGA